MNDKRLIELVRTYPVLFDFTNPKYVDTELKNDTWKVIGAEMNVDGTSCKTRWCNIRDNFRKSLNKLKTKNAASVKPYKYSEQLKFLRKFMEDREVKTSLEIDVMKDPTVTKEDVATESEETVQDAIVDVSKTEPTSTPRKKQKLSVPNDVQPKTASAIIMEYILQRNKSMECTKSKTKDSSTAPLPQHPVDAFLAGLAPVLKQLPPRQWHHAKAELFEITQKYEHNMLMSEEQLAEQGTSSVCSTPVLQCKYEKPSPAGSVSSNLGDE